MKSLLQEEFKLNKWFHFSVSVTDSTGTFYFDGVKKEGKTGIFCVFKNVGFILIFLFKYFLIDRFSI